jgi:IS605 OrfB family transposase
MNIPVLRTVSIKLDPTPEQAKMLLRLQAAYAQACNALVPVVIENRCWNRVALHRLAYYRLRESSPLGSQMVCSAIFTVCKAYKSQSALKRIGGTVPTINFSRASVHFDKRTYSIAGQRLSLYSISGRIKVSMRLGESQRRMMDGATPKEAELIHRRGRWFFNLVVETETSAALTSGPVLGVDVGENNLAATSTGKLFGGGDLRHHRDKHLAFRKRLQSNGSQSSRQLLCKVSGKEARRVKLENHRVSKKIVAEALRIGAQAICLEDLTDIRRSIKGGRRIRTRLHRWAFRQLQAFITYKAEEEGLAVLTVSPAYSSQTCSVCGEIGQRKRHLFSCSCGFRAHADCNAARNLARIAEGILSARAAVNRPNVAAA